MKRLTSTLIIPFLALIGAQSAHAISINLISTFTTNTAVVDIFAAGLYGQIVAAYDLDVGYDNSKLNATGVTFGPNLGGPVDSLQDFNLMPGIVNVAEVSLLIDPNAPDPEAALTALQAGKDPLYLASINFDCANNECDPNQQFQLLWTAGKDVKGRNNQVIAPTSVPEPTSFALFTLGLAALAWRQRNGGIMPQMGNS